MKLLVITQKVDKNDDVLGFFHDWIAELAKKFSMVTVICLQAGDFSLPFNVKVLSLGKESFRSTNSWSVWRRRIIYLWRFYYFCWTERKNYDKVFVHMNHNYVIYGYWLWRLLGKKIGLWYAHGAVPLSLHLAEKMTDMIFTSTSSGFRLNSSKLKIIGQGIDIKKFSAGMSSKKPKLPFTIVTVGRISAVKNIQLLLETALMLKRLDFPFVMRLAGLPITRVDRVYFDDIKQKITEKKLAAEVSFVGSIPYQKISYFYRTADLFINLSDTGSLDKAILEAIASGLKILTSNESARKILPADSITAKDPKIIADKIIFLAKNSQTDFRPLVAVNHSLDCLADKIFLNYNSL